MVDDANSTEDLESRYTELFQLVPVSIWVDDFSELKVFLDDLQANSVSDFNEYFSEHPDRIFDVIRTIHVVDVNEYTIMMYEARDKTEMLGSLEKVFTQESLTTFKDAIIAFVEGKPYFEGEGINQTLGGRILNVFIKIRYPDKPEQLNKVILSITDITHLKEMQNKFHEMEERYRIMLENASDVISLLDENMKIEYINENEAKLLGFEKQELIGKSALAFDRIHPDDLAIAIETFKKGFELGEGSGEFRISHKDGHYIWFDMKGKTFVDKDGKKWALLISRDISESKKMKEELMQFNQELEQRVNERTGDLELAKERLIRQEKLAAAGKISSTISHELRNPLAAISNSIYYLNMKLGNADEKIRRHIELIHAEVDRSRQIITKLLDYTRIKQPKFTTANIMVVMSNALNHVTVPDGITIQTIDNAGDLQMDIDSDLIQQAFINIITNAIQAMPQGGSLYITIDLDGEQVIVKFKDSGVGIPPENIQKLLEPLFTTKKSGIGLGLALVKDIVDKHGGEINVESAEGLGTTFTIFLPSTRDSE